MKSQQLKKYLDRFGNILILLGIIALANIVAQYAFVRFDLTSEKRHSLSDGTVETLEQLEDIVFIRVYLEGELPSGYKRLQNATKEMLEELRAYGGANIQYEFINPSASSNEEERVKVYRKLTEEGLKHVSVTNRSSDKVSEQILFPGAIVSYKGREQAIELLQSQMGTPEPVMINNSIQQLEYEFISTIKQLTPNTKKRVAFLEGHGELSTVEVEDFSNTLAKFYTVGRVRIDSNIIALNNYDAVIIANPKKPFDEADKFTLDQFVMRGGKIVWLVEPVDISMDSLQFKNTTLSIPQDLNLSDMLFNYGVRLNNDLVMDLQSRPIPVVTGMVGNSPRQEFFPWPYFPLAFPSEEHPISKGIDALKTEFASSIDTTEKAGINKTVILHSSPYTKLAKIPVRVSFNMLREKIDERQYKHQFVPMGVLLEGKFESIYKNRIVQKSEIEFQSSIDHNSMIVLSDGNLIENEVSPDGEKFFPVGFDKYTRQVYGNSDFLLNAVNYLLDDEGLLEVRGKEFKIRMLDPKKTENNKSLWQLLNLGLPILFIVIFGFVKFILRKNTYAKK